MDIPPPPPPVLQDDDPSVVDLARRRLAPSSPLTRLLKLLKLRSLSSPKQLLLVDDNTPDTCDDTPINLDNSALIDQDFVKDRYEWAVLYENQRGITFFSIPYYSSLSLLPSDPSPFTLPYASLKRSDQPPITLESYPLPDGNWHWVSRCWMVDMRSDSAEVQHDGFEYNLMFRKHNWSPRVGLFNARGWVRRRRWIRLMVRPAKQKKDDHDGFTTPSTSSKDSAVWTRPHSSPPSVLTRGADIIDHWLQTEPANVWSGDPKADWQRCLDVMKLFGRDGRKLELWSLWLGFYHPNQFPSANSKGKRREDGIETPLPSDIFAADILSRDSVSIAPRDRVVAVLRQHVSLS
ncbi:hypothetical protein BYT27DRAFT_7223239 [Phlegmacium glaucopus]|nr:hypothetical protein BYT27DRAFT_7223239 [Phlegmacium glaucopus]